MGDAIADGTDLHGDAVNVTARLQVECPPGWYLRVSVGPRPCSWPAGLEFEELGALRLKNIARPVEAYSVETFHDGNPEVRRTNPRS